MSKILQQEMQRQHEQIARMSSDVRDALRSAVKSLLENDPALAQDVIEGDEKINALRFNLEHDIAGLIATQQPVAIDVRRLLSALEVASELERMGDYAKDIARNAAKQPACTNSELQSELSEMAAAATAMLDQAMTAFENNDAKAAHAVAAADDQVDAQCHQLHRKIVEQVRSDETFFDTALRLLPIVHNVERFADRVTNICERIVYVATGEQVEFDGRS